MPGEQVKDMTFSDFHCDASFQLLLQPNVWGLIEILGSSFMLTKLKTSNLSWLIRDRLQNTSALQPVAGRTLQREVLICGRVLSLPVFENLVLLIFLLVHRCFWHFEAELPLKLNTLLNLRHEHIVTIWTFKNMFLNVSHKPLCF